MFSRHNLKHWINPAGASAISRPRPKLLHGCNTHVGSRNLLLVIVTSAQVFLAVSCLYFSNKIAQLLLVLSFTKVYWPLFREHAHHAFFTVQSVKKYFFADYGQAQLLFSRIIFFGSSNECQKLVSFAVFFAVVQERMIY